MLRSRRNKSSDMFETHIKIVETHTISLRDGSPPRIWVLATKKSKLFVTVMEGTAFATSLERVNPFIWKDAPYYTPPQELDPANMYPVAKTSYHRFRYRKGESHTAIYKKYRSPIDTAIDYKSLRILQSNHTALLTKREVETCERLRDHPHHNIAKYRGVQCSNRLKYTNCGEKLEVCLDTERVIKLVFKRYDCTLWDVVTDGQAVNIEQCLSSIAAGIKHLHNLSIVHSDIKPENIFVSRELGEDLERSLHYIVGDFDSCHRTGEVIWLKAGDLRWTKHKRDGKRAEEEDDWYAFGLLEAWLRASVM